MAFLFVVTVCAGLDFGEALMAFGFSELLADALLVWTLLAVPLGMPLVALIAVVAVLSGVSSLVVFLNAVLDAQLALGLGELMALAAMAQAGLSPVSRAVCVVEPIMAFPPELVAADSSILVVASPTARLVSVLLTRRPFGVVLSRRVGLSDTLAVRKAFCLSDKE